MEDALGHIKESEYGFLFHYYRAEVYRETNWRNRLDVTTNWAIVVTGGMLSYVFGDPNAPHTLILMNFLIVLIFLYIEARRFRYYDLLRKRTKLLEEQVLAPMFSPHRKEGKPISWWNDLSVSLSRPRIAMSRMESLAWRIRRHYLFMFGVLFLAWITKLFVTPTQRYSIQEAFNRAQLLFIPGEAVFLMFTATMIALIAIAYQIPKTSEEDDLP